jgi:phosphatidylglycerophosphatase C
MTAAVPGRSEVVVAAFDLDGTLTQGGSVFRWLAAVSSRRAALAAVLRRAPSLVWAALKSGSQADVSKERLFESLLRGMPLGEVAAESRGFAEHHLAAKLRTDTKARLDWHLAMGHRVVIVSASPELYVARVAELVGAHGVVATRLAVDQQGRLTGRYEGKNCRGTEKFSRVTSWMRSEGLLGSSEQSPVLWAYGNSRGDLRLLRAADHGVSCARLGQLSRLSQFPSLADTVARTAPDA